MKRALVAEGVGTALLLMAVVGSGIMGEQLADGNAALALLANAISTGAMLYGLITVFGPISGGHFNPAVTLCFWLRGEITTRCALLYGLAQVVGGVLGVLGHPRDVWPGGAAAIHHSPHWWGAMVV